MAVITLAMLIKRLGLPSFHIFEEKDIHQQIEEKTGIPGKYQKIHYTDRYAVLIISKDEFSDEIKTDQDDQFSDSELNDVKNEIYSLLKNENSKIKLKLKKEYIKNIAEDLLLNKE